MKNFKKIFPLFFFIVSFCQHINAQLNRPADSTADSNQLATEKFLINQKEQQRVDSMISIQLQKELGQVATDSKKKKELEDKLEQLSKKDSIRKADQLRKINELKQKAIGYPVMLLSDTLFFIYTRIGSFSAGERANAISDRIEKLYEDPFFKSGSLTKIQNETTYDIVYDNDNIIMSVTDLDALWYDQPSDKIAGDYLNKIKTQIIYEKKENSLLSWLKRAGYICLIVVGIWIIIFGINRLFKYTAKIIERKKNKYFKGITIRKIQVLSESHHYTFAIQVNNFLRIVIIILSIYLTLPLFFSVFPQTKNFADILLSWIITPARSIFYSVVHFLPDLFTIVIIYMATKYVVKFVKYLATEIEKGTIHINGFYRDWASPTFNVIRFLIYAFMFVIIFPYLPGSKSPAFQGVSVFLGVLFSLGSTSAISNIVAGMVITYMRPYKKGDRVKIGDVVGDIIEKTMLVTRIRTIKNEEITVPNSTVLSTHTINYSSNANDTGLIIHTTVTIGYDVPWKEMHHALIDAALRTEFVLEQPPPFVLQTSLDDFYVSYQINAYIKEVNKQAIIYSNLHQHIQDVCNEKGIEIMSPHYKAIRDGNMTSIPQTYVSPDYKPPSFNVKVDEDTTNKSPLK